MASPIRTPRVNNNDDLVRFTRIHRPPGTAVTIGELIAEIETDKASFTIESDRDGFVLGFVPPLGEMIPVGSVLGWLGERADEPIPELAPTAVTIAAPAVHEPTLKAALLLHQYGLSASEVPSTGERLSANDVLAHMRNSRPKPTINGNSRPPVLESDVELAAGQPVPLSVAERGMLKTVAWHRDVAVPGYVEIDYDPRPWAAYGSAFKDRHALLMDPLLALMAFHLVQLARENPKLNCTIVGTERHQYHRVALGFTMQTGARLTLLAVQDADRLEEKAFVDTLGGLMRRGMKGSLTTSDTSGVTIAFSSMARWRVVRHTPILAPHTALMVAHAASDDQHGTLGASYDHRVLTGGEVAVALRALALPPEESSAP